MIKASKHTDSSRTETKTREIGSTIKAQKSEEQPVDDAHNF